MRDSTRKARAASRVAAGWLVLISCCAMMGSGPLWAEWQPLAEDGIHDPYNPALSVLQEPAEALSQLPKDTANIGNKVRWVQALEEGISLTDSHTFTASDGSTQVVSVTITGTETSFRISPAR